MTGKFERWYPWYFCWIGGGIGVFLRLKVDVTDAQNLALLQSLISSAAILGGFLATALSIAMALSSRRLFRLLSHTGQNKVLLQYMLSAVASLLCVVGLSLIQIFVSGRSLWLDVLLLFFLGTAVLFSLLALVRLKAPLRNIMARIHEED